MFFEFSGFGVLTLFVHMACRSTRLQLGVSMSDLLHSLLRQQAALQLAFGQPAWDILIPVYYGNLKEEFNPARASAILIQVKNRDRPSPFSLDEHLHHYTSFFHTNDPILYILMNLGTSDNVVEVRGFPRAKALALPKNSALLKQHLFGIHLAGVDGTFACLQDPRLLMASKKLLEIVILKDDTPEILKNHDRHCQFNRRFDSHSWDGRYQVTQRMIEQDEEELDQEDTPMAGIE